MNSTVNNVYVESVINSSFDCVLQTGVDAYR
jgi:hypothetical protein